MPETTPAAPFAPDSVSMRLYPHNELPATELVAELCTQAGLAAEHGFDGVMTSEHHGGFAGYLPNPLQVTGFQLHAMSRGWAAPCPLLLPLRPVVMLVEEIAWLAARFPGRVGLGVAPGALPLDFEVMDVAQADAMPLFRAGLPRVVDMLAGRDLGGVAGDPALRACAEQPVPVLSTAMSPPAVRRAARVGAGVLFDGAATVAHQRGLSDAYVEAGGTGARVLIRRVWIGEPPRQAFEDQLDVYRSYSSEAAQANWRDNGWICGDQGDDLAEELAAAVRGANATALNLRVHAPGITPAQAREQIERLGDEVLPALRARLAASVA